MKFILLEGGDLLNLSLVEHITTRNLTGKNPKYTISYWTIAGHEVKEEFSNKNNRDKKFEKVKEMVLV